MKQISQPLYPKLSSIYNKILQLASAILLIIVLMSMLISIGDKNNSQLTKHFQYIAKQQLQQSIAGATVILEQGFQNKAEQNSVLQKYLDGLTEVDFVKQAHIYDDTGLLLVSSTSAEIDAQGNELHKPAAKTINDLYGISQHKRNVTNTVTPFIDEIRYSDTNNYKLHGYMRFTIEESYLTEALAEATEEQFSLQRLMLLIAGVVGFLLTRGLNRFSRRGYRLNSTEDTQVSDKAKESAL